MTKGEDRRTNIGKYEGADVEDGTQAERMAKFDRLPKRLRRFLADEAPFDYAVTPFGGYTSYSNDFLTMMAQLMVRNEVASAYGPDHPQARDAGPLKLTPRKTRRRG